MRSGVARRGTETLNVRCRVGLAVVVCLGALLAAPVYAQDEIQWRFQAGTGSGITTIGDFKTDDDASRDTYINFHFTGLVEHRSGVFSAALCATQGAPGEFAFSSPKTWKRGYCDGALGYMFYRNADLNLKIGGFGFVGQQWAISSPEGGFRAEPYPVRIGAGIVVYLGEDGKNWFYGGFVRDRTWRPAGSGWTGEALFQTNLFKIGPGAGVDNRTRFIGGAAGNWSFSNEVVVEVKDFRKLFGG